MRDGLMKGRAQLILFPLGMVGVLLLFILVERRPGLFADSALLGAILAVQVAIVGLSHFEEIFFPLMIGTFLWAGSSLPFFGTAMSLRWLFLGVGAVGGFVIWIRTPRASHFSSFHLVALFCVTSALISAAVSEVPETTLLKVCSLFMLFLYASSGARLAIAGREKQFVRGMVLGCEVLVYLSALSYYVFNFSVFGNPNSLGAIIGIIAFPVLLWAALAAETRGLRQRRFLALALCVGLLYTSNARASILDVTVVFLVFAVALRHQHLLLRWAFIAIFFLAAMAVINPSHLDELASSFTGRVIYKDQGNYRGVLGSRLSPWADTLSAVKQHPWFGSGFGTSELGDLRPASSTSLVYTIEGSNREHGSSYLALAEYMGILGFVPFAILIFILLRTVFRVCGWMRKTGHPHHYCIPFALVALAGLVHACFEDWLFAVGSYLCVFFWFSAFALIEMVPQIEHERPTNLISRAPMIGNVAAAHALR